MAERVWQKFETSLKIAVPSIENAVLPKIKATFLSIDINYLTSPECKLLIKNTLDNISENKIKVYKYLLELRNILKDAKRHKRKLPDIDVSEIPSKVFIKEENALIEEELKNDKTKKAAVIIPPQENVEPTISQRIREFNIFESLKDTVDIPKNNSKVSAPKINKDIRTLNEPSVTRSKESEKIVIKDTSKPPKDILDDPPALPTKIEKRIEKLESLLKTTQAEIERREEDELSLSDFDDENNSFILLDKLKAHCVKIWKTIAKLRKDESSINKRYYKKFIYEETPHKELNKRIEKFVKMKKFPDYNDIRNILIQYSKEKKMAMSNQRITEYASDIFTSVGIKLKKLRIRDFEKNFGNHLTDQVKITEDPVLVNESLKRNLTKNFFEGKAKLDKVIQHYNDLQYQDNIAEESASDIETDTDVDELNEADMEDLKEKEDTEIKKVNSNQSNLANENSEVQETRIKSKEPLQIFEYAPNVVIANANQPIEERVEVFQYNPDGQVNKENSQLKEPIQIFEYGPNGDVEQVNNDISLAEVNEPIVKPEISEVTMVAKDDEKIEEEIEELIPLEKPVKILIDDVPEKVLNEIKDHTFQFNIDQLKNKENSVFYNEVITLDSESDEDDEDNEDSVSDSGEEARNYGFSSKLDMVLYGRKISKQEPITITLDDSD